MKLKDTYSLEEKLYDKPRQHNEKQSHHFADKGPYSQSHGFSIGFPGGSDGKASAYHVGDLGSIPGSGRSSGEGKGNQLQYSCLENAMDGRAL